MVTNYKKQGKTNRKKGHNFERQIANELREVGFKEAKRALEYQEGTGIDLQGTGRFRIQCKNKKLYVNPSVINEVPVENGDIPILVTKAMRKRPMVCMYWDDFKRMLKDINMMGDVIENMSEGSAH